MDYNDNKTIITDELFETHNSLLKEEVERGYVIDKKEDESQMLIFNARQHDATDKEEMTVRLKNLRVQTLRNEGYASSSSLSSGTCTTEEDDDVDPEVRDSHLGEFVPPAEELRLKIIKQVESMFSDSFVYRDAFMTKHIRRGPEGFVSLRLVTSIRKIKSLSQDYRVVADALRGSEELEVNQDGTKVRRVKSLPETFDPALSQALLVTGLQRDGSHHEKVDEVVDVIMGLARLRGKQQGEGDHPPSTSLLNSKPSIRIIKEATHVPSSYGPEQAALFDFDRGTCLLLDFYGFEDIDVEEVRSRLAADASGAGWKYGLSVHKLPSVMADPRRKKPRKTKAQRGAEASGREPGKMASPSPVSSPMSKSGTTFSPHRPRQSSGNRLQVSSPWSTPGSSPRGSPRPKRQPGPSPLATALNSSGGESPAGSPWMRRKARNQPTVSAESNRSIFKVVREPRCPGEGRGFELTRKLI